MRKLKQWEARAEARLEGTYIWGSVVGAVASSVIGGLMSDDDGGGGGGQQQQQQQFSAAQERLMNSQANVADRQLVVSDEMLALWRTEQLPLIRAEVAKANAPAEVDRLTGEAAGDVKAQYAIAKEGSGRALELSGRNPSDPVYASQANQFASAEAADVGQAITTARNLAIEKKRQERIQAIALYGDPTGAATAAAGSAGALYGGAANNAARGSAIAMQGMQNSQQLRQQAGYAAGNTFGPAIKKTVNDWWGQPAAFNSPAAYGNTTDQGWNEEDQQGFGGGGGYSDFENYYGGYRHGGAIRRGYAEGGPISGPGSGTSDSIPAIKRPGTYILSADTVRAIGTKKVRDLMEKAGVRPGEGENSDGAGERVHLSSGEASLPPEVTKYYGEEFFNKLQQKYHRPVAETEGNELANGGAIRRRQLPLSVENAIFAATPSRAIRRS